jgi:hypothetical protein
MMPTVQKHIEDVLGTQVIISEKYNLKTGGPPVTVHIPGELMDDEGGPHIIYAGNRINPGNGRVLHYFSSGSRRTKDLRVPGDRIDLIE